VSAALTAILSKVCLISCLFLLLLSLCQDCNLSILFFTFPSSVSIVSFIHFSTQSYCLLVLPFSFSSDVSSTCHCACFRTDFCLSFHAVFMFFSFLVLSLCEVLAVFTIYIFHFIPAFGFRFSSFQHFPFFLRLIHIHVHFSPATWHAAHFLFLRRSLQARPLSAFYFWQPAAVGEISYLFALEDDRIEGLPVRELWPRSDRSMFDFFITLHQTCTDISSYTYPYLLYIAETIAIETEKRNRIIRRYQRSVSDLLARSH